MAGADENAVMTEEAGVVRRVLAAGLEDREPAPDLLRPPVPRRLPPRLRLPGLAPLRGRLRPGRASPGGRGCLGRAGPAPGPVVRSRYGVRHLVADPGRVLRFLALVSFAVAGSRSDSHSHPRSPWPSPPRPSSPAPSLFSCPASSSLSLAIPPRPLGRVLDRLGLGAARLGRAPDHRVDRRQLGPPHRAARARARVPRRPDHLVRRVADPGRHHPGLAVHRRPFGGGLRAPPGRSPLLVVRGLDVGYDGVQVLFSVDLDLDEGDLIALLGTNGAGKSTLLRAISGVTEADRGAVIFDGRDITHAPPWEIAGLGVLQVPAGRASSPRSRSRSTSGWAWTDDEPWDQPVPTRSPTSSPCSDDASMTRPPICPEASSRCWPSPCRWWGARCS